MWPGADNGIIGGSVCSDATMHIEYLPWRVVILLWVFVYKLLLHWRWSQYGFPTYFPICVYTLIALWLQLEHWNSGHYRSVSVDPSRRHVDVLKRSASARMLWSPCIMCVCVIRLVIRIRARTWSGMKTQTHLISQCLSPYPSIYYMRSHWDIFSVKSAASDYVCSSA